MNLLLDTHALIWWLEDSPQLGNAARRAIKAIENTCVISVVSAWEIAIKTAVGRLTLNLDPDESIPELFLLGFQPLSIQFRHAFTVRHLPLHHADPFDRMLLAQAQCEGMTLVTADERFAAYGVPALDATK